jgi:hypothetical protein
MDPDADSDEQEMYELTMTEIMVNLDTKEVDYWRDRIYKDTKR